MLKVTKGFFWSAVDYVSVQAIQFFISIIIARLVAPSAYGVIVMVQVFVSFAQLFIDSGLKNALIQKKDRTDIDFYTMFIFNLGVALFFYAVLFIVAPYIADFYNQPVLADLTRVIGLSMVLSSLSITQLARLQILLDFKTQAKARVLSVIISGIIGIGCAYHGMEVWALAIQGVVGAFVTSVLLMYFSRWMPRWRFSYQSFKHLAIFGSKLLFGNILTMFYIQITNLIIGKVYTPAQLAYYNRGFALSQLPSTSIVGVISQTVFPIYCELQSDKRNLLVAYNKYTRLSCLIIFPVLSIVGVFAFPLTIVLLTERWVGMAEYLSIFCLVFSFYPIFTNGGQIVMAVGQAGLLAKAVVVKRIIAFSLLVVTLPISVKLVAWGLVLSNFLEMIISMYCVRKALGYSFRSQLFVVSDIALLSIASICIAWVTTIFLDNPFLIILFGSMVCITLFISGMYLFKFKEEELINQIIHKVLKK